MYKKNSGRSRVTWLNANVRYSCLKSKKKNMFLVILGYFFFAESTVKRRNARAKPKLNGDEWDLCFF